MYVVGASEFDSGHVTPRCFESGLLSIAFGWPCGVSAHLRLG